MQKWLLLSVLTFFVSPLYAFEYVDTNTYLLAEHQYLEDETFIMATESVDLKGTCKDDTFFFSDTFSASGIFDNDLMGVARQTHFSGHAKEHLRLVSGQSLSISGNVERSAILVGGSIVIDRAAEIHHDAILVAKSVLIEGTIKGKTRLYAQSVTLAGTLGNDLHIVADDIVVLPGTRIDGNLSYLSSKDLILSDKVILTGKLKKLPVPETSIRDILVRQIYLMVSALIFGLFFAGFMPGITGHSVRLLKRETLKCFLVGVVTFAMIPFLILAFLITMLGIPFSIFLSLFYLLLLYMAKIPVALVVGGILLRKRGVQSFTGVFSSLIIGLVVLYAATLIPMLGFAIIMMIYFSGLGALLMAFRSHGKPLQVKLENLPPDLEAHLRQSSSETSNTNLNNQTKE